MQDFCLHLVASNNIYFVIVSTAQPTAFGYGETVTKGLAKSDL